VIQVSTSTSDMFKISEFLVSRLAASTVGPRTVQRCFSVVQALNKVNVGSIYCIGWHFVSHDDNDAHTTHRYTCILYQYGRSSCPEVATMAAVIIKDPPIFSIPDVNSHKSKRPKKVVNTGSNDSSRLATVAVTSLLPQYIGNTSLSQGIVKEKGPWDSGSLPSDPLALSWLL
jgi:hypothetical protein